MKVLRTIRTPWHPYAVTFSRDGTRLAIGGGAWYGHGGIMVIRLDGDEQELLRWDGIPGVTPDEEPPLLTVPSKTPTVSGLCFSDDDRFLAASMWLSCMHYRPSMLFHVDGTSLTYHSQYEREFDGVDPCPTGALLHAPFLITRNHGGDPDGEHVITLDPLPGDVLARNTLQHLTHHRMAVVNDIAITEAGGSRGLSRRQSDGTYTPKTAPEGLAMKDLRRPELPLQVVPVEDCPRVAAVAALRENGRFATGGIRGELDVWEARGEWRQRRVRPPQRHGDPHVPQSIFYRDASIGGIVSVARSSSLIAVTTGGELLRWTSEEVDLAWRLPEGGSPRSLAAHPSEPWVAVGIKQGDFAEPKATVLIAAVE